MENDYLIQRKPMNALFIFALPIIVGNLFQQFYTMADSAIVGPVCGGAGAGGGGGVLRAD